MPLVIHDECETSALGRACGNAGYRVAPHSDVRGHQCIQCNKVAYQYMASIKRIRQQGVELAGVDLLSMVEALTSLILEHLPGQAPWLDAAYGELHCLVGQLEAQGDEPEAAPIWGDNSSSSDVFSLKVYHRAMRIIIYYAMARQDETIDLQKAQIRYHQCVSVRPSPFDNTQRLQQKASLALSRPPLERSPSSIASTRSSSLSSSSGASCASCGIEKLRMPVCARCKTQAYCSMQCLKSCKHYLECGK